MSRSSSRAARASLTKRERSREATLRRSCIANGSGTLKVIFRIAINPILPESQNGRARHHQESLSRWLRSDPMNPLKTGPAVEIAIEAQNRSDTVTLHDRDVDGIAG